MSTGEANTTSTATDGHTSNENACCVCFRDVEIFSIGECDHIICFECSTRMRVLCGQNECPFCRRNVAKVIYSDDQQPYRLLDANIRSGLYDKRYRICFSTLHVQNAFYKLLENPCLKCPDTRTFVSFELLKKHMSREHQLYYCDLCTDNLKIFPFERRAYNRTDLALHNRKGDADNKSHRGHPLCEYCDVRYLDRDELFRHLRREHYFCHFCDADGSNQFYEDYPSLRTHFQREHFVCDEGGCAEEQFTGVFRTEIDLKAHQAKQHSSSMGKMAAKQARTLELEFSLVPRNRAGNGPGGGGGREDRGGGGGGNNREDRGRDRRDHQNGHHTIVVSEPGPSAINLHPRQTPKRVIDSNNEQEFPSLGGGGGNSGGGGNGTSSGNSRQQQEVTLRAKAFKSGGGKLSRTNENFPALGGGAPAATAGPSMGGNYKKVSASAILKAKPTATSNGGGEEAKTKPNTVIHISNRPKGNDFPALGRGGGGAGGGGGLSRNNEDSSPAVTEMMSQLHVNNSAISSKHRGLVDEYTIASAVANKQTSKIGLVQAAQPETKSPSKQAPVKLKLKSEENFPSLSGGGGATAGPSAWNAAGAPKWVNKPKVESRKAKVAANPLTETTKKNNNKQQQSKQSANETKGKGGEGNKSTNNGGGGGLVANGLILGQRSSSTASGGSGAAPPPPGFGTKSASQSGSKQPPPGFNVTLNSVARNSGAGGAGLMFTNSSGEKYKIVPTRRYIPPPMIQKRNQELVNVFKQTLTTVEAMSEFKTISQMFRENAYNAVPYYDHCKVALGEQFGEIFPELLALLPDIGKQQELFLVYRQNEGGKKGNKSAKLEVCPTCKQVLVPDDFKSHVDEHAVEQNFPKLSK